MVEPTPQSRRSLDYFTWHFIVGPDGTYLASLKTGSVLSRTGGLSGRVSVALGCRPEHLRDLSLLDRYRALNGALGRALSIEVAVEDFRSGLD